VINKAVDQWRSRLRASVNAKGHHFQHLLYTSADFRRDLTGSFQIHSLISKKYNIQYHSFFVVNVFSGSVATGSQFYMHLEASSFSVYSVPKIVKIGSGV